MPQHNPRHRDNEAVPRDTLRLPEEAGPPVADFFSAMIGFAGRAQAAIAEATLANMQQTLSTAQQAIDVTRQTTQETIGSPSEDRDEASTAVPVFQAIANRNLRAFDEMAIAAQKCTQAYVSLPSELAACRTPQDLLGLQLRFWRTTAGHCVTGGRRAMDALVGQADGTETRHVPTVAEVLGQRSIGPVDRTAQRDNHGAAKPEVSGSRDQARRGNGGEARLNA